MARRVNLPTADDLFRPTATPRESAARRVRAVPMRRRRSRPTSSTPPRRRWRPSPTRRKKPSGRIRHDEKMTVYVTSEELVDIEHARLGLRSRHGLAVDRGRLVREAIAMVLADFETRGVDSALVRRLTEE